MPETRKITVEVPEELLERARKASNEGITGTVRRGLELVAAARAYDELRKLRGKVRLGIDLEALRRTGDCNRQQFVDRILFGH
jgi:hypothetical protein